MDTARHLVYDNDDPLSNAPPSELPARIWLEDQAHTASVEGTNLNAALDRSVMSERVCQIQSTTTTTSSTVQSESFKRRSSAIKQRGQSSRRKSLQPI